jgi:hypothetical protein
MEQLKLDWSTAEVSDGKLTVALSGKPPKKWRDAFERTAALLSGHWDASLNSKKGSVQIVSVQPGDEERVRQFAEGVVLEANTTLVSEQELFDTASAADDDDDDEQQPEPDAPEPSRDERVTDRFREFAQKPANGDD